VGITRQTIVLKLANKAGGSHIDPELSETDYKLLRADPMEWMLFSSTGGSETIVHEEILGDPSDGIVAKVSHIDGGKSSEEPSLTSPVGAAVRQIAHELLGTMREQLDAHLS
jgi:hypothetical protein